MSAKFIYVVGKPGTGKSIIAEALEFFYRTHKNKVTVILDPEYSCASIAMLHRMQQRNDFVIVVSDDPGFQSVANGGDRRKGAAPLPWRTIRCEDHK